MVKQDFNFFERIAHLLIFHEQNEQFAQIAHFAQKILLKKGFT